MRNRVKETALFVAWLSGKDVGLWLADFPWPTPDL